LPNSHRREDEDELTHFRNEAKEGLILGDNQARTSPAPAPPPDRLTTAERSGPQDKGNLVQTARSRSSISPFGVSRAVNQSMSQSLQILKLPRRPPDHDLTLVIPAYNEESRLPRTLRQLREYLDQWGINYRVVVADDGSHDGTPYVAADFGPRFSTLSLPQNRGKGAAVRAAMLGASGRVAAFTDADLPYALKSLRAGYELIQSGHCQVAFGARDLEGSRQFVHRRILRRAASAVFSQIVRFLISPDVTDTQAGLKLFSAEASQAIFSRTVIDGFAFDAEVVFLTHHLGFNYRRIPVALINEESSSLSIWRHTLPMLREVFQIRLRGLRGAYAAMDPTSTPAQAEERKAAA
jgi:dolichyl-phosphate beta-glucosyltransferase